MKRGITGEYHIAEGDIKAFVPYPLPPSPDLFFSPETERLLENATVAIGRLDSISLLLPDPNIFLYSYVRREAVLSSQIEGTQSTLSDLLFYELDTFQGVPLDDVKEVSNYVQAIEHGLKKLENGSVLDNALLREMHEILLSSGRGSNKSPGKFRTTQNWIDGTRPASAHFVPPPPQELWKVMGQLESFIQDTKQPYPTLVKAALAHVQFETAHPFLDGNGRIGRLLIAFILHEAGLLQKPVLYLSLYFKEHRADYYRMLDLVRMEGDWERWLKFFLTAVEQTATSAFETAVRLKELFKVDADKLHRSSALEVFNAFCKRPISNIKSLGLATSLSIPGVTKAIKDLEKQGIIREITQKKRNRVYAYTQYINILNEGNEGIII